MTTGQDRPGSGGWSHLHPEDTGAAPVATSDDPTAWPPPDKQAPAPPAGQPTPAAPAPPGAPAGPAAQPAPAPKPGVAPIPPPPTVRPEYASQRPGGMMNADRPGVPAQSQQQRPQAQAPAGSVANPGSGEVLYEGVRKHTASFGGYLKWLLASAAGGAAAYGLGMIEFFSTWPLWVLSFVGLPGLLWTFLRHITTKYKISLRRIEFEHGVFSKTVDSLELWRVLDVRYGQSFIDRILGNATITLIGTDQTDPEMPIHGLPNHRRLFEQIREAVQAARHTSRPMEIVGQDGALENLGEY